MTVRKQVQVSEAAEKICFVSRRRSPDSSSGAARRPEEAGFILCI